jgi:hypothetical protein
MEPEEEKLQKETSEGPGLIPPVLSILAVVPQPNEPQDGPSTVQEDSTEGHGDIVVELPNF